MKFVSSENQSSAAKLNDMSKALIHTQIEIEFKLIGTFLICARILLMYTAENKCAYLKIYDFCEFEMR